MSILEFILIQLQLSLSQVQCTGRSRFLQVRNALLVGCDCRVPGGDAIGECLQRTRRRHAGGRNFSQSGCKSLVELMIGQAHCFGGKRLLLRCVGKGAQLKRRLKHALIHRRARGRSGNGRRSRPPRDIHADSAGHQGQREQGCQCDVGADEQ